MVQVYFSKMLCYGRDYLFEMQDATIISNSCQELSILLTPVPIDKALDPQSRLC